MTEGKTLLLEKEKKLYIEDLFSKLKKKVFRKSGKNYQNFVKKKLLLLKYQKLFTFFGKNLNKKMSCYSLCFHMESLPRNIE